MDKYTASAGAISSATAAMTTDLELNKIAIIGLFGALAYAMKSIKIAEAKANPIGTLFSLPWTVASPFALTLMVYYMGTDGVNIYINDFGELVWTFTGFAAGLFNDHIFRFIGMSAVMGRNKKLKGGS